MDALYRRTNNMFAKGFQKKSNWKPRFNRQSNNYQGEPIDIDAISSGRPQQQGRPQGQGQQRRQGQCLSPEENERRKNNNLCFFCGKPGHYAAECHSKNQNGQSQQQRQPQQGLSKQQRPQQKPNQK